MRLSLLLSAAVLVGGIASAQQNVPRPPSTVAPVTQSVEHPVVMLYMCEEDLCQKASGGVWVFEHDRGVGLWTGNFAGFNSDLQIENFDGKNITILRTDRADSITHRFALPGSDGRLQVRYTGTVNGNEITGTERWISLTPNVFHWKATISQVRCEQSKGCPLNADELVMLGNVAYGAKLNSASYICMKDAADLGNADGKGFMAYLIWKGKGTTNHDSQEAFRLAGQSARGGSVDGMFVLSKLYKAGYGTKADLEQADYWWQQATQARQDRDRKLAQAQQAQAFMPSTKAGAEALLLGLFAKALLDGGDSGGDQNYEYDSFDQGRRLEKFRDDQAWYSDGGTGNRPDDWHSGDEVPEPH